MNLMKKKIMRQSLIRCNKTLKKLLRLCKPMILMKMMNKIRMVKVKDFPLMLMMRMNQRMWKQKLRKIKIRNLKSSRS